MLRFPMGDRFTRVPSTRVVSQEHFDKGLTTMKRFLTAAFAFAVLALAVQAADAQVYQVYYPSAPVATYSTYYGPASVAVAPGPAVAYYPAAVPVTRYRPLLGGSVTRWRYVNQPVVYPTTAYYPVW